MEKQQPRKRLPARAPNPLGWAGGTRRASDWQTYTSLRQGQIYKQFAPFSCSGFCSFALVGQFASPIPITPPAHPPFFGISPAHPPHPPLAARRGAVRCGAVRCGVVRRGAVRCGVVRRGDST